MMLRILFIIPKDDDQDKYVIKLGPGEGIYIPVGIAQVAAVLLEDRHSVKVLDLRLHKNSRKAIDNMISRFRPDFIGLSISYFSKNHVHLISSHIKKKYRIPVIVGGPYVDVFGERILKNPAIDVLVYGEGDYTFSELVKSWDDKSMVKGIIFRSKGKVVKTGKRQQVMNLDALPFPAMHLFPVGRYIPQPKNYKKTPVIPIVTSRGCFWGRCTFCYQPGQSRRNSPGYVVRMIRHYVERFNVKEIRFWDDTLVDPGSWIMDFCRLLEREDLGVIWSCHARVNLVTRRTLAAMKRAGCWQVLYGIESGNQELLDRIQKGITLDQARDAVRWAKESGMQVRNSFMLGIPGETPETAEETIAFAEELDADLTQFSFATPYPGTKMHQDIEAVSGLDQNPDNYCEYKPVFVPSGYRDRNELEKKLEKAYRRLYLNPKFILRNISELKDMDSFRRYYNGLKVLAGMAWRR